MENQSEILGPSEYPGAGIISSPITSGSAVYPEMNSNIITNSIFWKESLITNDDKEKIDKIAIKYFEWQAKQYQKVYQQQICFGKIIFCLVIIIVLVGIVFSGIQFCHAIKYQLPTDSTVLLSPVNIQLTTSLVGVLILLLSLGFFYLFLRYAYIIKPPSNFIHNTIEKMKK